MNPFDNEKKMQCPFKVLTHQYHENVISKFNSIVGEGKDQRIIPDEIQRQRLDDCIKTPCVFDIKKGEVKLLWEFRYYIQDCPDALSKFLVSICGKKDHYAEAIEMMNDWTQLRIEQPIFLLSKMFTLQYFFYEKEKGEIRQDTVHFHKTIREFAVNQIPEILKQHEIKLELILLQLVSAVRYEFTKEQLQNPTENILESSPLAQFLIENCLITEKIACLIHWYILVEIDSPYKEISEVFKKLLKEIEDHLKIHSKSTYAILKDQIEFRNNVNKLNEEVVAEVELPGREA